MDPAAPKSVEPLPADTLPSQIQIRGGGQPPAPPPTPPPLSGQPSAEAEQFLFPPATREPAREIYSQPVPNSYDRLSDRRVEDVFDQAGTLGNDVPPNRRNPYPYGNDEYWYGHDANVEQWGKLLELPHVRLGWFAAVDTYVNKPSLNYHWNSGDTGPLAAEPVTLGAAGLNWNVSPHFDLGYRFEHGLGEIKVGYRYFNAQGVDPFPSFDSNGLGTISTKINMSVIDLDWCTLDFNSEGMPFIFPLLKSWGRAGLGKALTPNWFKPPMEIRWIFGIRGVTMNYESIGAGDQRFERVMNNFNGCGLHFAIDLNQRLRTSWPLFIHARAEGSGIFGFSDQVFERVGTGVNGISTVDRDGIGVPTAVVELGLSYAPQLPKRSTKVTLAWQREQWFCFGNGGVSSADLIMQGVLLRGEYKF
ncbi:MAG: hypothetical protein K8U03_00300 [Planctomycetia bacterium]|nr:hypothetical protein [Planctomycetia bacterium]